jgi:hypothetical protein
MSLSAAYFLKLRREVEQYEKVKSPLSELAIIGRLELRAQAAYLIAMGC